MNNVILVLTVLLDIVLMDSLFSGMFRRKPMPLWAIIVSAAVMAAGMTATNFIGLNRDLHFAIFIAIALTYSVTFYSGDLFLKFFTVLLLMVIILAGDQLGAGVILLVNPGENRTDLMREESVRWLGVASVYAYVLLTAAIFRFFPMRLANIPRVKSLSLLAIPLCSGIAAFATAAMKDRHAISSGWAYLMPFIMFFLIIISFVFIYRIADQTERKQKELTMLGIQLDYFGNTYESLGATVKEARAFRHDVVHHLNAIHSLALLGRSEEIAAYVEGIDPALTSIHDTRITAHPVVDALLRQKKIRAESSGIAFTTNISMPEHVGIPSSYLCVILSNALDNAIEACEREDGAKNRYIDVTINMGKPCLYLFVENSSAFQPVMENGVPISTKADRREHGYGLRNIRAVVEKFGGGMLPEWRQNRFILNCHVQLPDEIWEGE